MGYGTEIYFLPLAMKQGKTSFWSGWGRAYMVPGGGSQGQHFDLAHSREKVLSPRSAKGLASKVRSGRHI